MDSWWRRQQQPQQQPSNAVPRTNMSVLSVACLVAKFAASGRRPRRARDATRSAATPKAGSSAHVGVHSATAYHAAWTMIEGHGLGTRQSARKRASLGGYAAATVVRAPSRWMCLWSGRWLHQPCRPWHCTRCMQSTSSATFPVAAKKSRRAAFRQCEPTSQWWISNTS